jgi:hypothetical protein
MQDNARCETHVFGNSQTVFRDSLLEIRWQRRFKIFPFTGARMMEAQLPRVQHLAREILRQMRCIDFVAEHRVAEMMKVHANLMGASAMQPALN